MGRLIDHLVTENGMALEDLALIGHSLGAHICGIAARNVKAGLVPVIIGLDPALPLFNHDRKSERLQTSDAAYVMAIHTNSGKFGIPEPLGHADFYPNFGVDQPGCGNGVIGGMYLYSTQLLSYEKSTNHIFNKCPYFTDVCSHTRVHDLFLECLKPTSRFWATRCLSFDEIDEGRCTQSGEVELMGGDLESTERATGVFYVQTNPRAPFALSQVR